jgi:hypothetical protein
MNLGRPAMVSIALADSVPLPLEIDEQYLNSRGGVRRGDINDNLLQQPSNHPSMMSFYILSAKLSSITQHILLSFYSDENSGHSHGYDRYFIGPESVFQIDCELMKWCETIPSHLKLDSTILAGEERDKENLIFHRQAIVLWARSATLHLFALIPVQIACLFSLC